MPIPTSFLFTQSNLQDYVDCPRRFFLKHLRKLSWPSIESEPVQENEYLRLQGENFHKLVHQYFLGIPSKNISVFISDPLLRSWWENFLSHQEELINPTARFFPETTQSSVLNSHRILAKFDLFVIDPGGNCWIYDWKTYRRRPRREEIARKLQTRLYPWLIFHQRVISSTQESIYPEKLNLIYFYTNFPDQPERFEYNQAQYNKDLDYLSGLLMEIVQAAQGISDKNFPMTENPDRCHYCTYRSLCNRGIRAGKSDQIGLDLELGEAVSLESFDFDNIVEIEF